MIDRVRSLRTQLSRFTIFAGVPILPLLLSRMEVAKAFSRLSELSCILLKLSRTLKTTIRSFRKNSTSTTKSIELELATIFLNVEQFECIRPLTLTVSSRLIFPGDFEGLAQLSATIDRNFYIAIFVLTILRTLVSFLTLACRSWTDSSSSTRQSQSVARPDLLFGTLVYKDRPVSRLPIARERQIVDEDSVSRRQAQERHDARPLPSKDAELDLFFSDPPKWNLCETCLSMLVIAVGESRARYRN